MIEFLILRRWVQQLQVLRPFRYLHSRGVLHRPHPVCTVHGVCGFHGTHLRTVPVRLVFSADRTLGGLATENLQYVANSSVRRHGRLCAVWALHVRIRCVLFSP